MFPVLEGHESEKKTSKASLSGNLKSKNWVDFFESNFFDVGK